MGFASGLFSTYVDPHETILFLARETRKSRKSYPRATGGGEKERKGRKKREEKQREIAPGLPLYETLCTTLDGF